jgi:hypothetical protein
MNDGMLPRELVWDGAHVSELGLTSIADGQEAIVDPAAIEHAHVCEWCAGRLGRVALLSEAVGQAVQEVRPVSSRAPVRAAAGAWRALTAGIAVAFLAGLPVLAHVGWFVAYARTFFSRGVPVLARDGVALAQSEAVSRALPPASLAACALLVVMALMVARTRSQSFERSVS